MNAHRATPNGQSLQQAFDRISHCIYCGERISRPYPQDGVWRHDATRAVTCERVLS